MTLITAGGMPGWQITLIAVGAALAGAAVAVLLDRALTARKTIPPPPEPCLSATTPDRAAGHHLARGPDHRIRAAGQLVTLEHNDRAR